MLTTLNDFDQNSAKRAILFENQCYDTIFSQICSVWRRPIFIFLQNTLKSKLIDHNTQICNLNLLLCGWKFVQNFRMKIYPKSFVKSPCRHVIEVIAFAYRTEDPGFESRQVVRFSGLYTYIAVLLSNAFSLCVLEENKCFKKTFVKSIPVA
jgi:hypothetical protein